MLYNYFIVAVRNLLRYKSHSAINILGLSVGMACCLLIALYIQHELNYDRFHEKEHRIYRVLRENVGGEISPKVDLRTSGALGPAIVKEFSGVEQAARILGLSAKVWVRYEDKVFDHIFKTVDPNFLDVFSFPLIQGDRTTALQEPFTVVMTESAAKQYFGDEDPIGQILTCDERYFQGDYRVTGIIENIPSDSSVRIDMLTATVSPRFMQVWEGWSGPATWRPIQTYVLLKEGQSPDVLAEEMTALLERHLDANDVGKLKYHLQPLHRIHLYSNADYGIAQDIWMGVYGDINQVYLFGAVAILILLIACANYTNLTTARSIGRAREVGVRQVFGAHRVQIMAQFLSESILLVSISMGIAIGISEFALQYLNAFIGKSLSLQDELVFLAPFLICTILIVGILAGAYPAFFLSAFRPTDTLKRAIEPRSKGEWLRKSLVAFQFAITIALIVCTTMVYQQLDYISNKRLGYNPESLLTMPIFGRDRAIQTDASKRLAYRYQTVKEAFLNHPNVLKATAFRWDMGPEGGGGLRTVRTDGQEWQLRIQEADEDFLDTYGIEIIAGRYFTADMADNSAGDLVLNETAVKLLGWSEPLGKTLEWSGHKGRVIGVTKDYHDRSLKETIAPTAIVFQTRLLWSLSVRIKGQDIPETLQFLEKKWKQFLPTRAFTYAFVDENLAQMYQAEMKLGSLSRVFSIIAIFVACLGLFGLTSFSVEQRTKEIGIRKVLGASESGLVLMFSGEFTWLVLFANLAAWPLAYWTMNQWLANFVYRIDVGVMPFVMSGLFAFAIALATVGFQAWKKARANPVNALRCE